MIQLFNLGSYLNINDCEGRIFWGTLMREIQTHIIYIRINIKYYNELIVKLNKLDGYLSALRKVSTTNYDNIYGKPINVFNDKCIRTSKDIQVRIKDYKIICSSIKNSLDTAISKRDYYKSKRDYEESNPEIVYVKWWWED